jgi:NADH dehydrogenase (ubiquinone) Fe-S protein 4
MVVRKGTFCLLLSYPVRPLSWKLELFGTICNSSTMRALTNLFSIYRPAKAATQSGDWHGHQWRMDWDILSKGHRWENPLMGWQSSADFMQGTHLNFKSKEDAIRFAEKQGYEYFVQEPNSRKIVPKAYANNFLWSDKKLKHIRTK